MSVSIQTQIHIPKICSLSPGNQLYSGKKVGAEMPLRGEQGTKARAEVFSKVFPRTAFPVVCLHINSSFGALDVPAFRC